MTTGISSDGDAYSFKPCPRCGTLPVVREKLITTIEVRCLNCHAWIKTYGCVSELEEAWNGKKTKPQKRGSKGPQQASLISKSVGNNEK